MGTRQTNKYGALSAVDILWLLQDPSSISTGCLVPATDIRDSSQAIMIGVVDEVYA